MSRILNFSRELQQFSRDPTLLKVNVDSLWDLIKIPNHDAPRYYAVETTEVVGAGGFGCIARAYKFTATESIDLGHDWVAKIIENKSGLTAADFFKRCEFERAVFAKLYRAEPVVTVVEGKAYLFLEGLEGDELYNLMTESRFKSLSLVDRLILIEQLVTQLVRLHSADATHPAYVHGDIKPENILLDLEETKIKLIDFGSAWKIDSDQRIQRLRVPLGGSEGSVAPELYLKRAVGAKSDVYALVSVIAVLLGVTDPFFNKDEVRTTTANSASEATVPYCLEGILSMCPIDRESKAVKQAVINFLDKMQSLRYQDRPSSADVLRFFTCVKDFFDLEKHALKSATLLAIQDFKCKALATTHPSAGSDAVKQFCTFYKEGCRFSLFGALAPGRSSLGKKIFSGAPLSLEEIKDYVAEHPYDTAAAAWTAANFH